MKPKDWNQLPMEDKIDIGTRLANSGRGRYLLSQALVVAIEAMGKEEHPETSNIQDMEILAETHFGVFAGVIKMEREMRKRVGV
jgi:hypothetical protein